MHARDPADPSSRNVPAHSQAGQSSPRDTDAASDGELDLLAVRHLLGELDFLAVRHLLGELDSTEMARFAVVLGDDDAAVAALERADRLLAAITAAAPAAANSACLPHGASPGRVGDEWAPGHRSAGNGSRENRWLHRWRLGFGAAGIAAAVAAAVAMSALSSRSPVRPAEVLALWQSNAERHEDGLFDDGSPSEYGPLERFGDGLAWDGDMGDASWDAVFADDTFAGGGFAGGAARDAADAPPDWLLAAVALAEVRPQPRDSSGDPSGRH